VPFKAWSKLKSKKMAVEISNKVVELKFHDVARCAAWLQNNPAADVPATAQLASAMFWWAEKHKIVVIVFRRKRRPCVQSLVDMQAPAFIIKGSWP